MPRAKKRTYDQQEVVAGALAALTKFEGRVTGERAASFIKEMLSLEEEPSEILASAVEILEASERRAQVRWVPAARTFVRRVHPKPRAAGQRREKG